MSMPGISLYIEISHEAAGVFVRWFVLVNIDDGAIFVQAEHFPGALVMKFFPAHVLDMTKTKKRFFGVTEGIACQRWY